MADDLFKVIRIPFSCRACQQSPKFIPCKNNDNTCKHMCPCSFMTWANCTVDKNEHRHEVAISNEAKTNTLKEHYDK